MDIIAELVRSRLTEELLPIVDRDEIMEPLAEPARFNRVQIVTGMRRSGKTFYLFQQMHKLVKRGVPRQHIFYFDFSDDRLPLTDRVMDEVLDEYWRQVPSARTEGAYLFLDEVQDCEGWQGTCRRLSETERVTLTITGSSSKASSDEIATKFRGRSHAHEMLPLSFAEFVRFHQDRLPPSLCDRSYTGGSNREFSPLERTALESLFDVGLRLETAVYLELRRRMAGRRTDAISSYTDPGPRRQKVDFLVGEGYSGGPEPPAPYALYQVSLSLTAEKARRHELGSLEAAMARTGIDEGTVVTLRESEDVSLAQGVAHVIPAWRWFLERLCRATNRPALNHGSNATERGARTRARQAGAT